VVELSRQMETMKLVPPAAQRLTRHGKEQSYRTQLVAPVRFFLVFDYQRLRLGARARKSP
jgi:hypothetical protein